VLVGENQVDFTAEISTKEQIQIIKQITESSHEFVKDMYLIFVDFKQAYNQQKKYAVEHNGPTTNTYYARLDVDNMYEKH